MPAPTIRDFSPFEERFHALSHSLAAIVAVVGFFLLLTKASQRGSLPAMIAVSIYGVSMVSVFLTSAIYHMSGDSPRRGLFKLFDHIAIYFKISGSYTPFALILLPFPTGLWLMLGAWGATLVGASLETRAYLKRSKISRFSLPFYLGMGGAGVLILDQLYALMPLAGFLWLIAGGLSYAVGSLFYALKSVPYAHAVWHVFVIAGSACIFIAIYGFVI